MLPTGPVSGLETMDQAVPSQSSMRLSLWPALPPFCQYPTAVQVVAEVHEIPF